MKKLLSVILVICSLLGGNAYAETEKELKNKIGILEDLKENLIALNEGQKVVYPLDQSSLVFDHLKP